MPYESDKQRRYMHSQHPGIAARWDAEERGESPADEGMEPPMHETAEIALGVERHGKEHGMKPDRMDKIHKEFAHEMRKMAHAAMLDGHAKRHMKMPTPPPAVATPQPSTDLPAAPSDQDDERR